MIEVEGKDLAEARRTQDLPQFPEMSKKPSIYNNNNNNKKVSVRKSTTVEISLFTMN
jgi:hypothetical protein